MKRILATVAVLIGAALITTGCATNKVQSQADDLHRQKVEAKIDRADGFASRQMQRQ